METKTLILIFAIALLFAYAGGLFSVLQPQSGVFYQITGSCGSCNSQFPCPIQCDNADKLAFTNSFTVLNYKVDSTCQEIYRDGWRTQVNTAIYRDGMQLTVDDYGKPITDNLAPTWAGGQYNFKDVTMAFGQRYNSAYYSCQWALNALSFIAPSGALDYDITGFQESYTIGQNISASLDITNNWIPARVKVNVQYCTPTQFGKACRTDLVYDDVLPLGKTSIPIMIPTSQVTDKIEITPSFEAKATASELHVTGLNYPLDTPAKWRAVQPSDMISLGSASGNTTTISVLPTTIYIVKDCLSLGCPDGYTCRAEGYCTKTELYNQDCSTLGCPTGFDCQSTGVCTSTIVSGGEQTQSKLMQYINEWIDWFTNLIRGLFD